MKSPTEFYEQMCEKQREVANLLFSALHEEIVSPEQAFHLYVAMMSSAMFATISTFAVSGKEHELAKRAIQKMEEQIIESINRYDNAEH